MKLKKLICASILSISALASTITSFANYKYTYTADGVTKSGTVSFFYKSYLPRNTKDFITLTTEQDDGTIGNIIYKEYAEFPAWQIKDGGFYYYYQTGFNVLKNTTTPDGYNVDSLGRWIDSNGNPVVANIGNNVLNTKEKYAGKSDSEIKDLQIQYLRNLYQESSNASNSNCTGIYDESTSNISTATNLQYDNFMIHWNVENYIDKRTDFCRIGISSFVETTKVTELVMRTMFGDELGIEIFNYIKGIENTNNNDDCEGCAVRDFTNKFDLNKFKGRTTDYGKTIYNVTPEYDGSIYFMLNW